MYSEGGLKSLWRGNFVNVMKIFPETGLKFGIFETIKNNFCGAEPSKTQRFFAGATAGAMAQTCIYPIEVLKTRMVLRSTGQYSSVYNCARTIIQTEGFRSGFRKTNIFWNHGGAILKNLSKEHLAEDIFQPFLVSFLMPVWSFCLLRLQGVTYWVIIDGRQILREIFTGSFPPSLEVQVLSSLDR